MFNRQKWLEENKERISKVNKEYREKNKNNLLEKRKIWEENNKEHLKKYKAIWYQKNKEKVLKKRKEHYYNNQEKNIKYSTLWNRENPERRSEISIKSQFKRRTKMINAVNTLTAQEWLDILEAYHYRCAYCGIEFNCELLPTKDHIIPVSKGGNNTKDNIVPACRSCNSKKYNKINFIFC